MKEMSTEGKLFPLRKVFDNSTVKLLPYTYGNRISDKRFEAEGELLDTEIEYTTQGLNVFGRLLTSAAGEFVVQNSIEVFWITSPNQE